MGVHGLWQLLQPTGRPVTLESLEGKVLGIDVSIWLNQAVKGMRDHQGGALDNAHLLSLFHRICKLLFYRIKPVFVFDGGVPTLKRQTLNLRRQRKEEAESSSEKATRKILSNQLKQHALNTVLGGATADAVPVSARQPDLFELPPLPEAHGDEQPTEDSPNGEISDYDDLQCLNDVDYESSDFVSLPAEIQHELLTELKESRRRTDWARLDTLPQASADFSNYQIAKLRKQNKLSQKIEKIRRDMNAKSSGNIALSLSEDISASQIESHKVMSEDGAHYILIKGLSRINKPAQTLGVIPEAVDVSPLSERLSARGRSPVIASSTSDEPRDMESSYSGRSSTEKPPQLGGSQEGVKDPEDCHGYCTPLEVNNVRVVEVKDSAALPNNGGINSDTSDVRLKNDDMEPKQSKINEIAFDFQHGTTIVLSEEDSMESVNDTSVLHVDPEKLTPVKRVTESSNEHSLELSDEAKDAGGSSQNVWQQGDTEESSVSMADIEETQALSQQNSVTQDGDKEECIIVRHKDGEMEQTSEDDSDNDFIEVAPVVTDVTIQSDAATAGKAPFDVESSHSGHSSTDRSPQLGDDHDDSPVPESVNVFEGVSLPELEHIQVALDADTAQLEQERAQKQRSAATVTGQMYTEAQELLQLFGLPYMTSPMEAEAQCAYLDMTDQTDGSITDDSDIWLFGGRRSYKNFFNQTRDVEFYKMADIVAHLMLDRSQCISLAMLCGSDYTEGVTGVGTVTGMEILAEFPGVGIERLERFRDWWQLRQTQEKVTQETKIKGQLRKLQLQSGFPSDAVVDAYLNPAVDESRESFEWSRPDLDQLREFTKTRFGWTRQKVDESLLPVMKRLSQNQCQRSIMTYFPVHPTEPKRLKSKRVKAVLNRMRTTTHATASQVEADSNDVPTAMVKTKRRRKNAGNTSKNLGLPSSSSGGFIKETTTVAATEVLLSESSSGSDGDNGASDAAASVKTSQTRRKSQTIALSGKSGRNAVRQKKKASN